MSDDIPAIRKNDGRPDIVVAVYASGRCEARLRGCRKVIAEAPGTSAILQTLEGRYPAGFTVEYRDDPWM